MNISLFLYAHIQLGFLVKAESPSAKIDFIFYFIFLEKGEWEENLKCSSEVLTRAEVAADVDNIGFPHNFPATNPFVHSVHYTGFGACADHFIEKSISRFWLLSRRRQPPWKRRWRRFLEDWTANKSHNRHLRIFSNSAVNRRRKWNKGFKGRVLWFAPTMIGTYIFRGFLSKNNL